MRSPIIVANWKMYAESIADGSILATQIRNNAGKFQGVEVVLCPPSIWLPEIAQILKRGKVKLGVQNMFYEKDGPYTGEISPSMVKEMALYVIVGHSERREHFGENNFDVNEKVLAALKSGLIPIICVGEKNKNSNLSQTIKELSEALHSVPKKDYGKVVVAYEPVWAISSYGKGDNADPEYVAKVITRLREYVDADTPIIYGGSVKSANAEGYAKRPEIDGALVGAASIRAADFIKVCQIWSEAKKIS